MKYNLLKIYELMKDKLHIIFFILPALTGCLLFIFIPSIISFILSFCDWNLITPIKYIGLSNYKELISSYEFRLIFKNTIIYAAAVTILGTIIPLIIANVVNSKIKFKDVYKSAYFIPFITPMIVIAMIWEWIFDPNIGVVNSLLRTHTEWLYDTNTAMAVIITVSVWKITGYNMIIFLSGLSAVNQQVYEAAEIDGARADEIFMKITLPLISPTIFFVMIITTISSFQVFDLIYLMTQGGPENATNVIVYWIYKNAFELFNIGGASAAAYILFLFILVLTLVQWKLRTKWVLNETD